MQEEAIPAGTLIYSEGDPSLFVGIIDSGQVELLKSADGHPFSLAILGHGEIFGEMGVLDQVPRSTTARAVTPVTFQRLEREEFLKAMGGKDNPVALSLLRMMTRRLRETDRRLAEGLPPVAHVDAGSFRSIHLHAGSQIVDQQIGSEGIPIKKYPFRVGRRKLPGEAWDYDQTDLSLFDRAPFQLCPVHFALEIDAEGGAPVVHDLGSQLGTEVNGLRASRFDGQRALPLQMGDNEVIAGGRHSPFRFHIFLEPR